MSPIGTVAHLRRMLERLRKRSPHEWKKLMSFKGSNPRIVNCVAKHGSLVGDKARTTMWVGLGGEQVLIVDMDESHAKNALALIVYNLRRGMACVENPDTGTIKFVRNLVQ